MSKVDCRVPCDVYGFFASSAGGAPRPDRSAPRTARAGSTSQRSRTTQDVARDARMDDAVTCCVVGHEESRDPLSDPLSRDSDPLSRRAGSLSSRLRPAEANSVPEARAAVKGFLRERSRGAIGPSPHAAPGRRSGLWGQRSPSNWAEGARKADSGRARGARLSGRPADAGRMLIAAHESRQGVPPRPLLVRSRKAGDAAAADECGPSVGAREVAAGPRPLPSTMEAS